MTRLIDADALMEALKDNGTYLMGSGAGKSEYIYYSEAVYLINNAPTVEGEPVYFEDTQQQGWQICTEEIYDNIHEDNRWKLYTSPPQPQTGED